MSRSIVFPWRWQRTRDTEIFAFKWLTHNFREKRKTLKCLTNGCANCQLAEEQVSGLLCPTVSGTLWLWPKIKRTQRLWSTGNKEQPHRDGDYGQDTDGMSSMCVRAAKTVEISGVGINFEPTSLRCSASICPSFLPLYFLYTLFLDLKRRGTSKRTHFTYERNSLG